MEKLERLSPDEIMEVQLDEIEQLKLENAELRRALNLFVESDQPNAAFHSAIVKALLPDLLGQACFQDSDTLEQIK